LTLSSEAAPDYNTKRPHQSLDGATPDQAYFTTLPSEVRDVVGSLKRFSSSCLFIRTASENC
jgi:hypothetical protein